MKQSLSTTIDTIIFAILVGVTVLVPLVVTNVTTEIFEMPKLIFLGAATLILLLLTALSWVLKGNISYTRTPLDIPLLALAGVVIISTVFSVNANTSLFGNFPVVHGSAISWVIYVLFYFLLVNHIRTGRQIATVFYAFLGATGFVAFLSILSFLGLMLPFSFAKAASFTLTGSSFSTIALCLVFLPVTTLFTIAPIGTVKKITGMILTILFGMTVIFLGNPFLYGAALLIVAMTLFVAKHKELTKDPLYLAIPFVVIAGFALFAFLPQGGNPLYQKMQTFPREIQLPADSSWKIAISSFRDRPLIGTGPSTFLFNFTQYKPVEFNTSRFWNVRFGTSFNEFFQVLAVLGVLGLGVVLFIITKIGFLATRVLNTPDHLSLTQKVQEIGILLAALGAIVLLFVHTTTLVSLVATLVVFALFARSRLHHENFAPESHESVLHAPHSKISDIFPGITLTVIVGFVAWSMWQAVPVIAADYYHSLGIRQATIAGKAIDTYQNLARAEELNPRIDLYRTDLVTVNFALANTLALEKGPTEENPEGSLTDKDKQTILTLLSQAVAESRAAVALSPLNAGNWETMGALYGQITGVAPEAIQYSLDAYSKAIQLDPYNPNLRLTVGGIYYSLKNYELATRFFSDTVNLKPDMANGYHNLSITLAEKGDLQSAVLVAEQTVKVLESSKESEDYKVATDHLNKLKDELSKKQTEEQTSADEAAGSSKELTLPDGRNQPLQNKQLPELPINLQEKIVAPTPKPVEKNPQVDILPTAPSETPVPSQ